MSFPWMLLVAQMTCWHMTADQKLVQDSNCPATTQNDQGAVIFADDGTSVVVKGEFYLDGGWGMCVDGRPPDIFSEKASDIWDTVVNCRGNGSVNRDLNAHSLNGPCEVMPKYDIHYRSGLWQLHIYCPTPAAQS
jgi:hypothetical protein